MKIESQEVLGVKIDLLKREQVVEKVKEWVEEGGFHQIATVYSEFLIKGQEDAQFRQGLSRADLAVADGAGVLAAAQYKMRVGKGWVSRLVEGLRVGGRGLQGKNGQVVSGVWLSERLIKEAAVQGWRVYLLGGYGDRAKQLAEKFRENYPGVQIKANKGEQKVGEQPQVNKKVIEEIGEYQPEVLLVAYGPVKQEKWIDKYRDQLPVKVAMGVGGTFDELTGKVKEAPRWMKERGLKSFWRVMQEPKRIRRMLRAWLVFPWRVFREV